MFVRECIEILLGNILTPFGAHNATQYVYSFSRRQRNDLKFYHFHSGSMSIEMTNKISILLDLLKYNKNAFVFLLLIPRKQTNENMKFSIRP